MQFPAITLPFRRLPESDRVQPISSLQCRATSQPDVAADHRAEREAETIRYMRSEGILDTFLHFAAKPTHRC